ncbi:MAG TPA: ATP-dependent Clp protease adaptor ClpS [Longimicrobium sp.]|nr:ATP-dependent Clp protease adaptor ClpS [Longimicrobium sp.]
MIRRLPRSRADSTPRSVPVHRPMAITASTGDDRETEHEREEGVAVGERPKTRRPRLYRVLMHNDDYTTQEFVVGVLTRHFEKTVTEATRIMLQVHLAGVGVAGTYTRDEAETRIARVTDEAESEGYPLLLTMEPE